MSLSTKILTYFEGWLFKILLYASPVILLRYYISIFTGLVNIYFLSWINSLRLFSHRVICYIKLVIFLVLFLWISSSKFLKFLISLWSSCTIFSISLPSCYALFVKYSIWELILLSIISKYYILPNLNYCLYTQYAIWIFYFLLVYK